MVMRRAIAVGAAAFVFGGAGCALLAGIEEKQPIPCSTLSDCVAQAPKCWTATACEEGVCAAFRLVEEGTPVIGQSKDSCIQVVCDGAGSAKVVLKERVPCYTGTAETRGVGSCTDGVQECDWQGNPVGGCVGELKPVIETCDKGKKDEDCDDQENESGPDCICNDTFVSAGEECDDGNATDGDSCSADCKREYALPVAGYHRTCALLYNHRIKCWGENGSGELGLGHTDTIGDDVGEMGANLPAIDLKQKAIAVTTGESHTCALLDGGAVNCWGRNADGQLGRGDMVQVGDNPMEVGDFFNYVYLDANAVAIDAGEDHTCALLDGGAVKCWGRNDGGQLGQGDTNNRGDEPSEMGSALEPVDLGDGGKATAITVGAHHACAILEDGGVKCWGANTYGQLGLGDTKFRGDQPGEMGNDLPAVELGVGKKAVAISAGHYHTCAILDDESVKCWGLNKDFQLGLSIPSDDNRGDAQYEMINLPVVDLGLGATATAISAGETKTCVLLKDNRVKCWGANYSGELGLGDTSPRGDQPKTMGDNLHAVELGTAKTATAITVGSRHACAQLNNGSVKCWGGGDLGQLGSESQQDLGDALGEMGDKLPTVKLF